MTLKNTDSAPCTRDLKSEITALIESLGGETRECGGITYARLPGPPGPVIWTLTTPERDDNSIIARELFRTGRR